MPCRMHTDLWQQNCVHALLSAGAPANPQVTPCIGMMHPLPSWESKAAQTAKSAADWHTQTLLSRQHPLAGISEDTPETRSTALARMSREARAWA